VTTMEEVPIPSDEERAEMLASLRAAEERIAAGEYVEHDPETFVDEMMAIRASALAAKKTDLLSLSAPGMRAEIRGHSRFDQR